MHNLVLSRDLDSPLTHRERAAVDEWLASNKSLHIMRDHPLHGDFVLAGMWGFRPALSRNVSRYMLETLLNANIMKKYTGLGDQLFLFHTLWSLTENDAIVHDSYHCERFHDNPMPFPTKRLFGNGSNIFVGCVRPCLENQFPAGECPVACRPKNHKEWLYC